MAQIANAKDSAWAMRSFPIPLINWKNETGKPPAHGVLLPQDKNFREIETDGKKHAEHGNPQAPQSQFLAVAKT